MTGNVHRTWTAYLCGYPLLPYLLPTKTAQRHAVLSWYTYSGVPPSCDGYSVFTVMRIPIVARHNKTRWCKLKAAIITKVFHLFLLSTCSVRLLRIVPNYLPLYQNRWNLKYLVIYRVIYKSLRNFRTRLRNNQDRHGRKDHINR